MKISNEGKKVTKYFESLKLRDYPDPATGGKPWTIGYGHTEPDVYHGLPISQTRDEQILDADLAKAEAEVNKYGHNLTQGQFDCLVYMVFNMGSGFIRPDNINGDFDDFVNNRFVIINQEDFYLIHCSRGTHAEHQGLKLETELGQIIYIIVILMCLVGVKLEEIVQQYGP
ncbi:hypothetical protein [Klebsiella phage phiKp_21]|nr:hypothetical protein [Klebsiella phage phiKp_21]